MFEFAYNHTLCRHLLNLERKELFESINEASGSNYLIIELQGEVSSKQLKKNCISLNERLSRVGPLTPSICFLNATWIESIILKNPNNQPLNI